MKLKYFILFTVLTVSFACSKSDKTETISEAKINELTASKFSPSTNVVIYGMLNSAERKITWENHFTSILNKRNLNKAQRDLISRIRGFISSDLFAMGSSEKYSAEIAKFSYQAKQLFSPYEYVDIFESVATTESGMTSTSQNVAGGNSCYCNWDITCEKRTGSDLNWCNEQSGCEPTSSGCGFLWLSSCKGKCYPNENPPAS